MGFEGFLKIDGVPGESTDSKYKDQIEILSFSHGLAQPTSAVASTAGGGTTGRCKHDDFTIVKLLDKATPLLAQKCCDGSHIDSVVLTMLRAGGADRVAYMEIKLSNVVISKVRPTGSKHGDEFPTEEVALNYGKIEWTYTQQKRGGGGGSGTTAGGWDLQENKKV